MRHYTYFLVNFFAIIICLIFSFHPKIKFYKHFGVFLKSSIAVAIPYIIWDVYFTGIGAWWFNNDYTVGVRILGLPIEEMLFFICIPFSCIYTYFCFNKFFNLSRFSRYNKWVVAVVLILSVILAITCNYKIYPFVTAIVTIISLLYLYFIAKASWISEASFVFLWLMLGFIPVNGVLTGSFLEAPIVNYNPNQILNIRLFTIPIEDIFYGYTQFLLNVYLFKFVSKKHHEN